jgi:transposase-like protein
VFEIDQQRHDGPAGDSDHVRRSVALVDRAPHALDGPCQRERPSRVAVAGKIDREHPMVVAQPPHLRGPRAATGAERGGRASPHLLDRPVAADSPGGQLGGVNVVPEGFLSVRPDGPKEGVLVAWGFTERGERVLLSVMLGMRESHEDWLALGRDLIARGLGAPLLIVADGAPGLIKAVEQCWPASDRQHCAVHRVRNLLAKLPERERERVRQAYWRALDEAINERDGRQRLQTLADELDQSGYTAAAKCLADDLEALVVHLRYPTRHRRRWRSTNLLERSLGEVKRRTKVIGRFPGETSCLTLVWAVLDLYISHATNGIRLTQLEHQRLRQMRYEGHAQPIPEEVAAA